MILRLILISETRPSGRAVMASVCFLICNLGVAVIECGRDNGFVFLCGSETSCFTVFI